jgi:hypothetical protein
MHRCPIVDEQRSDPRVKRWTTAAVPGSAGFRASRAAVFGHARIRTQPVEATGTTLASTAHRGLHHTPHPDGEEVVVIRRLASGSYRLYSRKVDPQTGKRRNLGTFFSREAALRHERQIQFFKRAR